MNKLKFITIFTAIILCLTLYIKCDNDKVIYDIDIQKNITINDPPNFKVYSAVNKYCKIYDIPPHIMFGLLYQETKYKGIYDWNYRPNQISSTGALGPAQILLSTARGLNKDNVSREKLLNDIDYNIMTSAKFLRRLKDKYNDWGVCLGYYNSGYPKINNYALKIINKEYTWVK